MPKTHTERMLERQIDIELRKLNTIMTDEADKPAIIQRIAELKAMLDKPNSEKDESEPKTISQVLSEAIAAWRNR